MTLKTCRPPLRPLCIMMLSASIGFGAANAAPQAVEREFIPTGMHITPTAAPGSVYQPLNPDLPDRPEYVVDHASDMAISPDGNTLLILTSGYNRVYGSDGSRIADQSNEYVFVYDIGSGQPLKQQVIQVPNTFNGITWHPNGEAFYVSGGVDDNIHTYNRVGSVWQENGDPIELGHDGSGEGVGVRPMAAGLSVNVSGTRLLVANFENDSISLIDLGSRAVVDELDLRPGKIDLTNSGTPGGTYPLAVRFKGDGKAYVTSQRDREILVVSVDGDELAVQKRISTQGQPNKMTLNQAMSKLFVASDNDDAVLVVDTQADEIIETIPTFAPGHFFKQQERLKGANPNNVALSADEKLLFVTNGGTNSVAVIKLVPELPVSFDRYRISSQLIGLIPTGWYPNAVVGSADGSMLYVVNAKDVAGPNPDGCRDTVSIEPGSLDECRSANQYVWQLHKAGFLSLPMPRPAQLAKLTLQVAKNSHLLNVVWNKADRKLIEFLRDRIKHVVYIVKENRTYDQVLGDLPIGNGDPSLAILSAYSPNHRKLALDFVTLDNFYDSGETSGVGWNWSTAARTTDFTEKTQPVNYAGRGLSYDWEGSNRNVNVSFPTLAERMATDPNMPDDPDMLPGTADVAAPDSREGEAGAGYLWDGALRAGLTLRNYGFFVANQGHSNDMSDEELANPYASGLVQAVARKSALVPYTDPYYRGYDQSNADFYLYKEWEREFDAHVEQGEMPNLTLLRFPHDHFGNFSTAKFGVNTVETQMADNDYAMGMVIDKIAHSPFKNDTLIFVIEDDAQNGGDHVDPHRSIAYIVGPYIKRGALVSKAYTTVNFLHTMEEILGIEPLNLNDGLAQLMDVFDVTQKEWDYTAVVPEILYTTQLPLPDANLAVVDSGYTRCDVRPLRSVSYWRERMKGQNFAIEDKLDEDQFNRALWAGLKGHDAPYPSRRSGLDLRDNRGALLAKHRSVLQQACNSQIASR